MYFPHGHPHTPAIGEKLEIIPYVRCPIDYDNIRPAHECVGCNCYNPDQSTDKAIVCHYCDDNDDLRDAIQNKEAIIAACIRGSSGYDARVFSGAVVEDCDRGDI